jgi:hypothetical protein
MPRGTTERMLPLHRLEQGTLPMRTIVHSLNFLVTLASENLNYHKIKETNVVGSINIKYINIVTCRDPLLGNDSATNNETTQLIGNRFLISNN